MSIRVRAKSDGFYKGARRRKGTIFTIENERQIGKWMEVIDPPAKPIPAVPMVASSPAVTAPTPDQDPLPVSVAETVQDEQAVTEEVPNPALVTDPVEQKEAVKEQDAPAAPAKPISAKPKGGNK